MNIDNLLNVNLIPHAISLISAYAIAVFSLLYGKLTREKILLALICVTWTMISWAFISHNLITDFTLLLKTERYIHSVIVFVPVITLYLFQTICETHNRRILFLSVLTSIILSVFTHTNLYFYGFNAYPWGIVAKPGPVFHVFMVYAGILTLYTYHIFTEKIKKETNPVIILKIKYFFISFLLSALLSFFNFPSTMGINIYPLSAFIFIPLWILAYGIFQPKVKDINWFFLQNFNLLTIAFLFLFPNLVILHGVRHYLLEMNYWTMGATLTMWFTINYFYVIKIQPIIEVLLNRNNRHLETIEKNFIKEVSFLKGINELIENMRKTIIQSVKTERVDIFLKADNSASYRDVLLNRVYEGTSIESILKHSESYIERNFLKSLKVLPEESELIIFMENYNYEYIIPLNHNGSLIAFLALSPKKNGKRLTENEARFIHIISTYATIALYNSMIYQNLSDIKDNLEKMVKERTEIINRQKEELENEIQLAHKFQTTLLPQNIPNLMEADIAYKYAPYIGVGGDLIGIHHRNDMNELGLFICDVSGHGITAAIIASMVKMSLNSWGVHIKNPSDALLDMRKKLNGKLGDNFLTACMCTIDLDSGRMVYSNAGHPPVMVASTSGLIQKINAKGRMISDLIQSDYEQFAFTLKPGDKVIMYTDGVTEVHNPDGLMSGEDMFIEIIKRNLHLSSERLCDKIYEELMLFSGENKSMDDDFTLLIAEYKGKPGP